MSMRLRVKGFTLIELMVALAVLAILVVAVVPSFMGFRQRTVLEGAAEQLVSVWSEARFEALRRDRNLFVTLRHDSRNVRTEARHLGKECVRTCSSRWSPNY